jgi:hypothetical protein
MMETPAASSAPPGDGPATAEQPPAQPATGTSPPPPRRSPSTVDLPAIEGPVWVAWREGTLTRAKELEALCLSVKPGDKEENDDVLARAIQCHLDAARQAARVGPLDPLRRLGTFRNGSLIERAKSNLDAA